MLFSGETRPELKTVGGDYELASLDSRIIMIIKRFG